MLATVDKIRRMAVENLDLKRRSELGQYMTPTVIAKFMASLFSNLNIKVKLLDAGAGAGSLTAAFLNRHVESNNLNEIDVTAYELDPALLPFYQENISYYENEFKQKGIEANINLVNADFVHEAVQNMEGKFTHAILNPPYKKIQSSSQHRKLLRTAQIETVNMYSAFVALAIGLLKNNGELVAIVPRSFCNGSYYKPFREIILKETAIQQIHLFESRNKAFKEDSVLQENIIIHLVKGVKQKEVTLSKSTDDTFEDLTEFTCEFDKIVKPGNSERFIHIPNNEANILEESNAITYSLADLGISVSTGPVVDFRIREHLFKDSKSDTVPLLYPIHFNGVEVEWPKDSKRPNAIAHNAATQKMLYPVGFYVVVRRFSSKEEKQRIVARVINPTKLGSEYIGIENHLNVFHSNKAGISKELAYGLAAYLNTSFVDTHFRSFNGHTQVNATDLKQMKYPSKETLIKLGEKASMLSSFEASQMDKMIETLL